MGQVLRCITTSHGIWSTSPSWHKEPIERSCFQPLRIAVESQAQSRRRGKELSCLGLGWNLLISISCWFPFWTEVTWTRYDRGVVSQAVCFNDSTINGSGQNVTKKIPNSHVWQLVSCSCAVQHDVSFLGSSWWVDKMCPADLRPVK